MVSADKIGWGKYSSYEGPYFGGVVKYVLPTNPDEDDRRLRVLTATESGTYDAVNMYDSCIVSIGLIQWCEAQYYLSSKLLHQVSEDGCSAVVQSALAPALTASNSSFKKNASGQWRFFLNADSQLTIEGKDVTLPAGEVNSRDRQLALFLGCDGKQGSWTDSTRAQAKLWAACMANVWTDVAAQVSHAAYTKKRLMGFVLPQARNVLWDGTNDGGLHGMLRAAFISFAGNNPSLASTHAIKAAGELKSPKWSIEWCTGVIKEMTFGPGVAIYSTRYDKIRPWLEQLWPGTTLPKTADDLKKWEEPELKADAASPVVTTPVPQPEAVTPVPPEQIITIPFPKAPVGPVPGPSGGFLAFLLKFLISFFTKK